MEEYIGHTQLAHGDVKMRRNSKAEPVLHLETVQCSANQIFRNFTGIIVQINCKHSIQMDIHKNSSESVLLLSCKDICGYLSRTSYTYQPPQKSQIPLLWPGLLYYGWSDCFTLRSMLLNLGSFLKYKFCSRTTNKAKRSEEIQ
ncbi:uncharacterized protein [Symphalangus syndactylus]|uniref:uncharacterized protein n=1 Tax=Symphalangus syndactylus TaxID=9590 RepID=UPI0030040842